MSKEINCIILGLGYIEDGSVAPLIFTTDESGVPYMGPREALITLAEDLFEIYKSELPNPKECCVKYWDEPNFDYCPTCGKLLGYLLKCSAIDFGERIWKILSQNNNSVSHDGVKTKNGYHVFRWHPSMDFIYHIKGGTYLNIDESGDSIIPAIIEALKPGTFDDIDDIGYIGLDDNESFQHWLDRMVSLIDMKEFD